MKSGMKSSGMLKQGLKNRAAMAPSKKAKGASVNNGATRSGTAPTPRTLGPRTA